MVTLQSHSSSSNKYYQFVHIPKVLASTARMNDIVPFIQASNIAISMQGAQFEVTI